MDKLNHFVPYNAGHAPKTKTFISIQSDAIKLTLHDEGKLAKRKIEAEKTKKKKKKQQRESQAKPVWRTETILWRVVERERCATAI